MICSEQEEVTSVEQTCLVQPMELQYKQHFKA